jgi:WD40 repeat protein
MIDRRTRSLAVATFLGLLASAAACRTDSVSTTALAPEPLSPIETPTKDAPLTLPPELTKTAGQILDAWPAPIDVSFRDDESLEVRFSDGRRRRWHAQEGWGADVSDVPPSSSLSLSRLPSALRWCTTEEDCDPPFAVVRRATNDDAALTDDGTAVIHWDLREGRPVAGILLPDGARQLAVGGGTATVLGPRWLAFWDLRRREVTAVRAGAPTRASALSQDGSTLAMATETLVEIWNPQTIRRKAVAALPGLPRLVAVSPSGAHIAVSGDRWLRIFTREGDPIGWIGLAIRRFEAVTPDDEGLSLAGIDGAGAIDLVDLQSGTTRRFSEAPEAVEVGRGVRYVEFSRDGRHLLNGGPGSRVAVWDRESGWMRLRVLNLLGSSPTSRAVFVPPHHLLVSAIHDAPVPGCLLWDLDTGALETLSSPRCEALRQGSTARGLTADDEVQVSLSEGAARVRFGDADEFLVVPVETVDGPDNLVFDRRGAPLFIPQAALPDGSLLPTTVSTRRSWRDLHATPGSALNISAQPPASPNIAEEPPATHSPVDIIAPRLKIHRTVHGCTPTLAGPPEPLFEGRAELRLPQGVWLYPRGDARLAAPAQVTPGCGSTLRRFYVSVVADARLPTILDALAPASRYARRELVDRGTVLEALLVAPWAFASPGDPRPDLPSPSALKRSAPQATPGTIIWVRMVRAHGQVWIAVAESSPTDWPFLAPVVEASFHSLAVHRAVPGPLPPISAIEPFTWPREPNSAIVSDAHFSWRTSTMSTVVLRADGKVSWSRENGSIERGIKEPNLPFLAEFLGVIESEPIWRLADEGPGAQDSLRPPPSAPVIDLGGIAPIRPVWELGWRPPPSGGEPQLSSGVNRLVRELWSWVP